MSPLELAAKEFATAAHAGQVRKYTGEPYINHPAAVAELVRSVSHSQEMLAAAWLHDVVEDCNIAATHSEALNLIWDKFGWKVAKLVHYLTNASKPEDGNRAARKEIDRKFLAKAAPDAKTVKLGDLIDNSDSIMTRDPEFAKVYMAEKRALLGVLTAGDPVLWERANKIVTDWEKNHGT